MMTDDSVRPGLSSVATHYAALLIGQDHTVSGSVDGGAPWRYEPNDREKSLSAAVPKITADHFFAPKEGAHGKRIATYEDFRVIFKHETGVYRDGAKHEWRGDELWIKDLADSQWRQALADELKSPREVAAYRTDQMLGFGLVPTTVSGSYDHHAVSAAGAPTYQPLGPGSIQEYVPGASWKDYLTESEAQFGKLPLQMWDVLQQVRITKCDVADRQQAAVLDYIIGNDDRHGNNWLSPKPEYGADRLALVDNGDSFPATDLGRINSDFLKDGFRQWLHPEVLAQVRAVDPEHYRQMLLDTGLSESAANGAQARLLEIQRDGTITGDAWKGEIGTHGKVLRSGSGASANHDAQMKSINKAMEHGRDTDWEGPQGPQVSPSPRSPEIK